jgi:hypothetical protein
MNAHSVRPNLYLSFRLRRLTAIAALCFAAPLSAQTFTSFDAPGAGTSPDQGTFGYAINASGEIAGSYLDSERVNHSFVRSASGVITDFDPPSLTQTNAMGINASGQIVGHGLHDGTHFGVGYGYLRSPQGSFTPLSVNNSFETFPYAINDSGEIVGTAYVKPAIWTAFIVTFSNGSPTYTVFEAPHAATKQLGQGTFGTAINASGQTAGYYNDAVTGALHGFLRDSTGKFTSFDAPGAGTLSFSGTVPLAINRSGQVAGYYTDNNFAEHGFLRDASGAITVFDVPGAIQTYAGSINDSGEIVGQWYNSQSVSAGFTRDPSGSITSFTAPVPNTFTAIYSINDSGQFTGSYSDLNGVFHGFLD